MGRFTIVARAASVVLLFGFIGMIGTPAWAQTGTASLIGEVTDDQKAFIPGVSVTLTHSLAGTSQTTVSDERGAYRFIGVSPGTYTLTVELTGFRTTTVEGLVLRVDSTSRQDVILSVGGLTETVNVVAATTQLNTTDASTGNALSREQIRSLPVEAQNVVHLLSLQPGAVFIPVNINSDPEDARYGSVAGARSDQQNVTLDGVDVNDPQNQTAYTSAIRLTQEALQEFRVSTSSYNADQGRSSGPQVTLVTRSGTNQFDGSGYWMFRRTATSSNEYFLKLTQLSQGQESKPPKLDKDIFGGSLGGPIMRNRMFFFANYEGMREKSETPVTRGVPSNSLRDGVLIYQCASAGACPGGSVQGFTGAHSVAPGFYGMTPAQIAAIDPLGIGPSQAAMQYFRQYPSPNAPGLDGRNIMDYTFSAPIENRFNPFIMRVDYNVTESGNHKFFGRYGQQRDTINNPSQFPDQDARLQRRFTNYGLALGYDSVLSSNLMNSFRYGLTRIDEANVGLTNNNYVVFRFMSPFDAAGDTFTSTRATPTQNIVNDLTWVQGRHTLKTGTNIRFTRVPKDRYQSAFLSATVNPSWVAGVGRRNMPGSSFCTVPGCDLPAVATAGQAGYADAWLNILGVLSQSTLRANYNPDGSLQPVGAPVSREIASDEYEFYVQDSWQLRSNFTLTAGLRYSLYSPPYEVNGFQVQPTISMGEWFNQRVENAKNGIPSHASEIVTFDLSGPKNNRPGFYAWDKNNVAPRVAFAWSPTGSEGSFWRKLTGENKTVIRGGYTKVFDRVGVGLATNFDEGFAFGMSTSISSPFGGAYESDPRVRFVDNTTMPPTVPAAPPGGFPQTPPIRAGIITQSIDDTLVTPSAHMASFTIGRDLGQNYAFEVGYLGRFGRDLLIRRDMAMPLNLVDTQSGTDYFSSVQGLIRAAQAAGLTSSSPAAAYQALANMPYWQNMFPDAAGGGLTATQAIAHSYMQNGPDWITAFYDLDTACSPACSRFGPYSYFSEQYDSLAGISSIGRSNYNAMLLTLRRRYAGGLQYDINYTLSQSKDLGSQVERGSAFGNFANGGYSGFLINSFDPDSNYGTSDFDVRHQLNVNWLADLPFGQGRRYGGGVGNAMNAIIGDWSVAGLWRWTSGFPFNVYNCRSCWTTNWNLQGNTMLVDPNRLPETKTVRDAVDGRPSPFADAEDALSYFRSALPGEVGIRNMLRGDGYFVIDLNVAKSFRLGIADHRLRFLWSVFNVTNTVRFDVGMLNNFPDRAGFGRYDGSLATCDAQAGRCMQFALRYEF